MSIITIHYEAKCKHCKFFKYSNLINNDGDRSKVKRAFCTNTKSNKFAEQLTQKTIACNKIEL